MPRTTLKEFRVYVGSRCLFISDFSDDADGFAEGYNRHAAGRAKAKVGLYALSTPSQRLAMIPATKEEQLAEVKYHANKHYEQGWDLVVETMTDEDILKVIENCHSTGGAISAVGRHIAPMVSYRREIQSTAF